MFKNYFILNRLVIEANILLKDYSLVSAFTQDKERIIFELKNNDRKKFIEISTIPNFEFISIKDNFSRAKKNTIDFFSPHLPSKIASFKISVKDRIIRIGLDNTNDAFYFLIRGKSSNVVLIADNIIADSFKKIDPANMEELAKEISGQSFLPSKNLPIIGVYNEDSFLADAKLNFPFIGKEIFSEVKLRKGNYSAMNYSEILNSVIEEVFTESIIVYYDTDLQRQRLIIKTFHYQGENINEFQSAFEALNYFLQTKHYRDDFSSSYNRISKFLTKELERTTERLNTVHLILQSKSKENEYNKIANLLLINIPQISRNTDSITIPDIYDNDSTLIIKLDKSLSPEKNAESYFDKAKNEKIKFERARRDLIIASGKMEKIKKLIEVLSESTKIEELKMIMKKIKLPAAASNEIKDELKDKFRNFIIDGKYNVFVGKDSVNNDLLTVKFAKLNDYWFHARSVSGSHVVLKVDNVKEGIQKSVLKKAASLAAYYSKAKTSGIVPVSYTLRKYVIKKKGMEPGKVALLKEDVLIVKPEIPIGCVMVEKE